MRHAVAHRRAFVVSLGVSVFFHLSMVTIFSIVIIFPPQRIRYYSFRLVQPPSGRASVAVQTDRLRVPSPGKAPTDLAWNEGGETKAAYDPWAALPAIELPRLEFAELRRLRAREEGLVLAERREALLQPEPRDAWARFGQGIDRFTSALSRLRLSGRDDAEEDQPQLAPATRPAAGFEAYIEWTSEPRDRQLLFAPPMEALWGVDPETFAKPIVVEFTVSPEGRVVSAWSPNVDETGIITDVQNALLKYRFESVDTQAPQQATIQIVAARTLP